MIRVQIKFANNAISEEPTLDVCLTKLLTALGDASCVIELTPYRIHLAKSDNHKEHESIFSASWQELQPVFAVAVAFLTLVNPSLIKVSPLSEIKLAEKARCCPGLSKTDPKKTAIVLAAGSDPCKVENYTNRLSDMIAAFCLSQEGFKFEEALQLAR